MPAKKTTKKSAAKKTTKKKTVAKKATEKKDVKKPRKKSSRPKIRINKVVHDVDKESVIDLKKDFVEPEDILAELLQEQEKPKRFKKIKLPKFSKPVKQVMGPQKIVKTYRKMALGFVSFSIILLAIILYFSLVKVDIVLKLKAEGVRDNLVVDVYDRGDDYVIPESAVRGIVRKIEVEQSKTYPATGKDVLGEEVVGAITVVNKRSRKQPLVATTRFLSSGGILFRSKEYVEIPAQGQAQVQVYADQPSKDIEIGDDHFIIPGLPAVWQDEVYALSKKGDIKYQQKIKKIITEEDIKKAKEDLKNVLIQKAKKDVADAYSEFNQKLYKIVEDTIKFKTNAEPDDEKTEFTIDLNADVDIVAFNNQAIYNMSEKKLSVNLPVNKQLASLNKDNFSYNLGIVDIKKGTAKITVDFMGNTNLKKGYDFLDKKKILNLNKEQLSNYLDSISWIDSYQLKFYPNWLERTPILVDRIKVRVAGN